MAEMNQLLGFLGLSDIVDCYQEAAILTSYSG